MIGLGVAVGNGLAQAATARAIIRPPASTRLKEVDEACLEVCATGGVFTISPSPDYLLVFRGAIFSSQ